jgi:Terpene cyclase DEP1
MQRVLLSLVLAGFCVLSALALWHHGYWGIIAPQFQTLGTAQVLADLVIALGMVMVWMWRDARAAGRNAWPWIVLTLVAGSFGPLLYLLSRTGAKPAR